MDVSCCFSEYSGLAFPAHWHVNRFVARRSCVLSFYSSLFRLRSQTLRRYLFACHYGFQEPASFSFQPQKIPEQQIETSNLSTSVKTSWYTARTQLAVSLCCVHYRCTQLYCSGWTANYDSKGFQNYFLHFCYVYIRPWCTRLTNVLTTTHVRSTYAIFWHTALSVRHNHMYDKCWWIPMGEIFSAHNNGIMWAG